MLIKNIYLASSLYKCWEYRESNVDLNIVNFFNVIKRKITTNGWNFTKNVYEHLIEQKERPVKHQVKWANCLIFNNNLVIGKIYKVITVIIH